MKMVVNPVPFRPAPKCAKKGLLVPLWQTSGRALDAIQDGRRNCGTPLRLLSEHVRQLCGTSAEQFRKRCDEKSRGILRRQYHAAYTPHRRKQMTDDSLRLRLLEFAGEIENLSRTLEARETNVIARSFIDGVCTLVGDPVEIRKAAD